MVDLGTTIDNLELNIRWIEDIPAHQFPGWGNTTAAMRDAVELLKEQERIIKLYEKAEPFLHSHGWDWTQVDGWVKQE